jgi:hypothetical protein
MASLTDPPYPFIRIGGYIKWGELAVLGGVPFFSEGGIDDSKVVLWGYSGHCINRISTLRLENQRKRDGKCYL